MGQGIHLKRIFGMVRIQMLDWGAGVGVEVCIEWTRLEIPKGLCLDRGKFNKGFHRDIRKIRAV